MTHDAVLVFSKTWGAVYLFLFYVAAIIWAYWPKHKKRYDDAATAILGDEEVRK